MEASSQRFNEPSFEALEADITELWGHLNAATYRFPCLLAEFDRQQGFERHGLVNTAQWLNWQCGIGTVAAREKVRVARALEQLPSISEAFRLGRLSYSKVRALTRVAMPESEADLLQIALHGTAVHVERLVRQFRRVERLEESQQTQSRHRGRYVRCHYDDDGAFVLHAVLPGEVGALVAKAIEAATEGVHESLDETESNDSAEARRADALRYLAEHFLHCEAERCPASGERYRVVVHVSESRLRHPAAEAEARQDLGDDPAHAVESKPGLPAQSLGDATPDPRDARQWREIEQGPVLAADTLRRLACDNRIIGLLENGDGEPLDVGRQTRALSPAMKRALACRDGGCRFPGCDYTRFTEGHHVQHWADGGETKLANLITLCRYHHRLVHEGGYGLRATDDGIFRFNGPDGRRIDESGTIEPRLRGSIEAENAGLGLLIDAETSRCGWCGERMDYGLAVEALYWHRLGVADRWASSAPDKRPN